MVSIGIARMRLFVGQGKIEGPIEVYAIPVWTWAIGSDKHQIDNIDGQPVQAILGIVTRSYEDIGWDWEQRGLGHFEYCVCGCSLTNGELIALELPQPDVDYKHTDAIITQARIKLAHRANVNYGRKL